MAGIYIHIPFCRKACHYCNFHFSTSTASAPQMIRAIAKEAALQNGYLNENIATIYFGGGTPSLLDVEDLLWLMDTLHTNYTIMDDAEITLETNPDDITAQKLQQWKAAGINRLSIGVQSFFEEDLLWMNRAHSAIQAKESIDLARKYGYEDITIDLIFGTPGLTDEKWKSNFDTAVSLGIPHISCYALTVEAGTALEKMIHLKKKESISSDQQSRQFELLMQWAAVNGFEHYEISNFAKPGFRSRHNSSYWKGLSYLGLGPSAHSFNGKSRQWNIANNASYIKNIESGNIPFELEELSVTQQLNEYIMIRLRTAEGLSLKAILLNWGHEAEKEIFQKAAPFVSENKMIEQEGHLVLTNEGKLFADGIAAALFK